MQEAGEFCLFVVFLGFNQDDNTEGFSFGFSTWDLVLKTVCNNYDFNPRLHTL